MIYASLFDYPLKREVGVPGWNEAVAREIGLGEQSKRAGFRSLYRARDLGDLQLSVLGSATLAKARSGEACNFLRSGHSHWLSFDDDIETDSLSLQALIEVAGDDGISFGTVIQNDGRVLNSMPFGDAVSLERVRGHRSLRLRGCGAALMCCSRSAVQRIYDSCPELEYRSDVHQVSRALFLERLEGYEWAGEDYSFCSRALAAGVELWTPADIAVRHGGVLFCLGAALDRERHDTEPPSSEPLQSVQ